MRQQFFVVGFDEHARDVDVHFTEVAGQLDLDAARERVLVALTMEGRAMEIDLRTGEVLWEHDEIHDMTEYMGAEEGDPRQYARLAVSGLYYVDDPSFLDAAR